MLVASAAVYTLSFLLIRTLSRYRELAADRSGALLTGRPSDLARALTTLDSSLSRIPTRDLRTAQSFNAFFITPVRGSQDGFSALLSTHPSLDKRLEQLAALSIQLGETV